MDIASVGCTEAISFLLSQKIWKRKNILGLLQSLVVSNDKTYESKQTQSLHSQACHLL